MTDADGMGTTSELCCWRSLSPSIWRRLKARLHLYCPSFGNKVEDAITTTGLQWARTQSSFREPPPTPVHHPIGLAWGDDATRLWDTTGGPGNAYPKKSEIPKMPGGSDLYCWWRTRVPVVIHWNLRLPTTSPDLDIWTVLLATEMYGNQYKSTVVVCANLYLLVLKSQVADCKRQRHFQIMKSKFL